MKKIILSAVMTALLVSGCGGGGGGGKKPEVEKPISFVKVFSDCYPIVVGTSSDGGQLLIGTLTNENNKIVRKYDKNGNIQWQYTVENGWINPAGVFENSDRTYLITGNSAKFQGNEFPSRDAIVAKLSKDGQLQWYKNIGGGGYEAIESATQTPDGGIIGVGYTESSDIPGISNPDKKMVPYYFRTDKDGNVLWQKTYGDENISLEKVFTKGDKTFIYWLHITNHISDGRFSGELDNNGDVLSPVEIKTSKPISFEDIKTMGENIIIGGAAYYLDTTDRNLFVMSANEKFEENWSSEKGGSDEDSIEKVDTYNGQIYAAGYTDSPEFDGMPALGDRDIYAAKYNSDGSLVWQKRIGGERSEGVYDMKATPDGGMIITGYTASKNFAGTSIPDNGGSKEFFYLLKLDKDGNITK